MKHFKTIRGKLMAGCLVAIAFLVRPEPAGSIPPTMLEAVAGRVAITALEQCQICSPCFVVFTCCYCTGGCGCPCGTKDCGGQCNTQGGCLACCGTGFGGVEGAQCLTDCNYPAAW